MAPDTPRRLPAAGGLRGGLGTIAAPRLGTDGGEEWILRAERMRRLCSEGCVRIRALTPASRAGGLGRGSHGFAVGYRMPRASRVLPACVPGCIGPGYAKTGGPEGARPGAAPKAVPRLKPNYKRASAGNSRGPRQKLQLAGCAARTAADVPARKPGKMRRRKGGACASTEAQRGRSGPFGWHQRLILVVGAEVVVVIGAARVLL